MKPDERKLLDALQRLTRDMEQPPYARAVARDLGMHPKRATSIFDKWAGKGWYEYGVSVMAGWLTDEGMDA